MLIQVPPWLSQCRVGFHVNWVNAEWYSTSTESTRSGIPRQLSQRGVGFHINWVNAEWDSTSTESTRSGIPRQLSQCGEGFHVNWVNTEWDSTSTESRRSGIPRQLSQHGMRRYLRRFHHSALTQLMWSLTPHWLRSEQESHSAWLSCREMRLLVNWVIAQLYKYDCVGEVVLQCHFYQLDSSNPMVFNSTKCNAARWRGSGRDTIKLCKIMQC